MKKSFFAIFLSIILLFTCSATLMSGCKEKTFTVTFSANAEDAVLFTGETEQRVTKAEEIEPPVFVRKGYNFAGWSKVIREITESTTVYANWAKYQFTVTFNGNGGEFVSGEVKQEVDSGLSIVAPTFEKTGHLLTWDVKLQTLGEDTVVNAVWVPMTFKVTLLDDDGQTKLFDDITVTYGEKVDLPVKNNRQNGDVTEKFSRWKDQQGRTVPNGFVWRELKDVTLTAEWTALGQYLLFFDLAGGEEKEYPYTYESVKGITIGEEYQPIREGYIFDGWTGTDIDEPVKVIEIPANSVNDRNYTANWTAKEYQMQLDLNGGTIEGEQIKQVRYDQAIGELPVPEKEGYVFDKWTYDGVPVNSQTVWKFDVADGEPMKLVAQYKRVYVITFSTDVTIRGKQIKIRVLNGLDLSTIKVTLIEGERLNKYLSWDVMPVVAPEDNGEYFYDNVWRFFGKNNKECKIYLDTPITPETCPGAESTGIITLTPKILSSWTPFF